MERERNTIEEWLNSTKRLDELEDDEGRLKRLNEQDQAIIDDVYASEFDKEAASERIAARDEDLLRLKAQISERENSLPLPERIEQIFKKYGVTVTAIFLAASVTIGGVIGVITNALKKLGTDLGNGLKTIGAKAASALPGIIGAIVSFLFKAAGSAIGFLAEHTWLLILAVVAFLFPKLMKKRKRDAKNNRATTPITPTITAVLLISRCGVFSSIVGFSDSNGGFSEVCSTFGLGDCAAMAAL